MAAGSGRCGGWSSSGVIVAALIAGWLMPGRGEAAAFPPSERLLPASTRVWVSAADPQALKKRF
ncbi:MAG: hypothetical protein ACKOWG_17595, partial [Planctomycetia bacterium]